MRPLEYRTESGILNITNINKGDVVKRKGDIIFVSRANGDDDVYNYASSQEAQRCLNNFVHASRIDKNFQTNYPQGYRELKEKITQLESRIEELEKKSVRENRHDH